MIHLNHANLQLQVESARQMYPVDPQLNAASPAAQATPSPVDPRLLQSDICYEQSNHRVKSQAHEHWEGIKQEVPTYPDIYTYPVLYKLLNQPTH